MGADIFLTTRRRALGRMYRFIQTVVTRPRIGRDHDETKDFVCMVTPATSSALGTRPVCDPKISEFRGFAEAILGLAPVFDMGEGDRETK
jgi:hypothetical protein